MNEATALMNSGDVKMAGFAGVVLSVAQVIHRVSDALDHKETLEKAVAQAGSRNRVMNKIQ